MTRLVLIRHGEAQTALDGILGGERHCNGLSEEGRRQAVALRDRLVATDELGTVDALYASSLRRAYETAEIIAPAIGDPEIRVDRDLREFDPGEADGMSWDEFNSRFPLPEVFDPHRPRVPSGESWATFGERVERALAQIVERHENQTVVVACHGGVIEHAFHLWGIPTIDGLFIEIFNTGITEFVWSEPWPWHSPGPNRWRLVRHNDAAHLYGLANLPPKTSADAV
jgi:2,3-bisphosphoglycerate-dependent phosphoglycerate mutase